MSHSAICLRRGVTVVVTAGTLMTALTVGPARAAHAPLPATLAADSPSPSPTHPAVRYLSHQLARQLDAAVGNVMRKANIPGATVGIWTPGQPSYVRSFGVADKSTGRKMTPDLYMRIGSETKPFTVTALLQLVDQKKVGLDDPIGKYVDGVPNGEKITLRQLADMRSGLYNYSEDPAFDKALTSNPQRPFTPQQLLAYSFKHPVMFQPGQKFSYSNTNTILLGLVVEKETGQHLGDYIKQHILDPAGMTHTLFPTGNDIPTPHAQGYTKPTTNGRETDATHWNPSWAWAAGAMISDFKDLRTWAPMVVTGRFPDGTRMVSAATQKQRLTAPPTRILKGMGYGLGIFNVDGWTGHNGSLPGYQTLALYLPTTKTTLVVLANTDTNHEHQLPSTLLGQAITKIITPGHIYNLAPAASAE
ncbi:serine hydrolase domain-containing protein [Streptomyces sp. NPDC048191]|uniref:serine hydrolase domain-containing protein n=1 Tax=Streptomyces sp. NPDC048191 TaxID=3155484 RepID=UPI0033DE468E